MNLHEYQGKNILKSFGVSIQEGKVAHSVSEAMDAAKELTNRNWYRMVCCESSNSCRRKRQGEGD